MLRRSSTSSNTVHAGFAHDGLGAPSYDSLESPTFISSPSTILLCVMKPTRIALTLLLTAAFLALPAAHAQNTSKVGAAFDKFWAAQSPAEAEKTVDDIVKTGITFDEAFSRLKAGRT